MKNSKIEMKGKIITGKYYASANFSILIIFVLTISILAALFSLPAFAQQCLTEVSTSTSTSRATTGTSVTVTVTTVGTSCTVNTLAFVSTPSLTINDPASGQYSGFSAGTAKTFTVTAGTAGTYNYYAQGTTSAGSVPSTQKVLEFVSPSDLTVSVSPSSASVTQGNSFTLTVSVQNPQSSDVTTSYTLNLPSGLIRTSGDPTSSSGTTISGSSTKTLSLTLKHQTCFTSGTVTFDLGGSTGVASVSVTGNSTCDTAAAADTTTGGGGGAAGGGAEIVTKVAYSTGKATVDIPVIQGGATEVVDLDPAETNLDKLEITVVGIARSINVVIEKSSLPLGTPAAPGNVFHYLVITKSNLSDENVQSAKLEFRVEKTWIANSKIDDNTIALYRYTTQWDKMATTKLSDDGTYVYYSATSPGLSVFAISGEKTAEALAEEQRAAEEAAQQNVTGPLGPIAGVDFGTILMWLVGIIVVVGGGYLIYKKYIEKKPYVYKSASKK